MSNVGPPPVQPRNERAVTVAESNLATIQGYFTDNKNAEAKAIRAMFAGDETLMKRFLAVAFAALARDDQVLREADPLSVLVAIKDAAEMGLEPSGINGEGFINVYKRQAKFQPMYRGILKRIRNSGKVADLDTQLVYENDEFSIALGTNPEISHTPALGERGDFRGVYAWALMPSGLRLIEWMTVDDVNEVRDQFSQAWKSGRANPWQTSWGEMARKTVLLRLSKRLPGEAVNLLLAAEASVHEEVRQLSKQTNEGLTEVRNMALRAVGALPESTTMATAESSAGDEAMTQELEADAAYQQAVASEGSAADEQAGNVQAAMELAAEQERLRKFRQ